MNELKIWVVKSLIKKIGYLLIKVKHIKEGEGFGSVSVLLNGYGRCKEATICVAIRWSGGGH